MNHMTVNDSDAPWNEKQYPKEEIEVTVSITLSKTLKLKVDDYKVNTEEDEDGKYLDFNFSKCDLYKALDDQVVLPYNLASYTKEIFNHDLELKAVGMPLYLKQAIEDCSNWILDDMSVVKE